MQEAEREGEEEKCRDGFGERDAKVLLFSSDHRVMMRCKQ